MSTSMVEWEKKGGKKKCCSTKFPDDNQLYDSAHVELETIFKVGISLVNRLNFKRSIKLKYRKIILCASPHLFPLSTKSMWQKFRFKFIKYLKLEIDSIKMITLCLSRSIGSSTTTTTKTRKKCMNFGECAKFSIRHIKMPVLWSGMSLVSMYMLHAMYSSAKLCCRFRCSLFKRHFNYVIWK